MAPPSDDDLRAMLRDAGIRATPARVAVLRLLHQSDVPKTHAEATEDLSQHGWDRATLFRNLSDMTRVGLLRRVDLGDRVWRFELATTNSGHDAGNDHPHFLCTQCGDVSCLPDLSIPEAANVPSAVLNGQVDIQIRGLCDDCG